MFRPDDPLKPPAPVFEQPWHAQALALADSMVQAGHFSATDWAEALGAALAAAEARGAPDTQESYFLCVVEALEALTARRTPIGSAALAERKAAWERAYRATPHGRPVVLGAEKG